MGGDDLKDITRLTGQLARYMDDYQCRCLLCLYAVNCTGSNWRGRAWLHAIPRQARFQINRMEARHKPGGCAVSNRSLTAKASTAMRHLQQRQAAPPLSERARERLGNLPNG